MSTNGGGIAEQRDFATIAVGDRAEFVHAISQADVDRFAALSGDYNPLHVDEDYAETTTFRRPVAHGMLSASFISTMIGMRLPGKGALWTSQTLEFLRPVYVGDQLRIEAVVEQKSHVMRTLVLRTRVINQHGQDVVTGTAKVKVLESIEREQKTMSNSESRVILVTGGSGGIGAAIVTSLAAMGHRVAVNYVRSASSAETLVQSLRDQGWQAKSFEGDVGDEDMMSRMFADIERDFGPVQDIVHCAAPMPRPTPFDILSWGDYQSQLNTQLHGAFNCVRAGLPRMIEAGNGSVVFIGSIYSGGAPPAQQSPYIVAKAALSALARTLAVEYGPKGIRFNIVSPGMTQTEMIAGLPEKVKLLAKMQAPLRQLADPADVANAVTFLLGPNARHITGETLRVCGGTAMV